MLMEQKNPKFLQSLRNTRRNTTNLAISYIEKSKESYPGLSSTTDESSDSRSDWTEDVDEADEGRSMMGTDPWAHESVTAVTGSKKNDNNLLF